ncbi:MAG: hypothetical protein WAU88_04420, partial [Candidatus Zixiibacteriota bacterium]
MNNFPGALTYLRPQLRPVGMISILLIAVVGFLAPKVNGQQADSLSPEMWGIKNLTEYLNLRSEDITYRSDYTEPDSFRLKIVADLMKNPIGMEDYAARLRKAYVKRQPEVLAASLFGELKGEYQIRRSLPYQPTADELQKKYTLFYSHLRINEVLTRADAYVNVIIPRSTDKAMAFLTAKQQRFLRNEFKEFLEVDSLEETRTVEQLDSSERRQEQLSDSFVTFGYKFDKDPIMAASIDCLRELMPEIQHIRRYLDSTGGNADKLMGTPAYVPPNVSMESYLGRQKGWKIGGTGNDTYSGDYSFILDLGGDDTYDLSYDPAHP